MTTAEIITIGTEIVSGQIVDTNSPYIAKTLMGKGIQVLFQTSVGDDKELLKSVLKIASDRATLIITTGGLGPTENDITRETISELFNIPLVPDEEAYVHIQKHLVNLHPNVQDGYKKQAMIPEGAVVIHNDNGTAIGFAIQHGDTDIVCLPGVPREMQSMLNKYLEIYAGKNRSEEGCTLTRNIHTFGISERAVEDFLRDYVAQKTTTKLPPLIPPLRRGGDREGLTNNFPVSSPQPPVTNTPTSTFIKLRTRGICREEQIKAMTLVHDGIVTINILATAVTREHAVKILDRTERDIRKELGHAVFGVGDETLESAVALLLKKYNKTIAVAESCTGGLVSDKLTNIPGISEYFLEGVVAYSNEAKVDILGVSGELIEKYGAVSSQVAMAMAEGVKKRSSANMGVGITGIAGPTGATKGKPVGLVYIAVVVDNVAEVKECKFSGSRIDIKNFSANTALNMVRLGLI